MAVAYEVVRIALVFGGWAARLIVYAVRNGVKTYRFLFFVLSAFVLPNLIGGVLSGIPYNKSSGEGTSGYIPFCAYRRKEWPYS